MSNARKFPLILVAAAIPFLGPQSVLEPVHAQATQLDDVLMYGIDADTNKLLRYHFDSDTFVEVGVVKDQTNTLVEDIEGMAYIPSGPNKGFYGTTNFKDNDPTKLIKINPMNARAWMFPNPVGFWKVTGLVAYQDPGTGEWTLIGATKNTDEADLQAKLITIDPDVTSPTRGIGTQIMDLGIMMMSGLAIDANGTLYGVDRGLNNPGEVPPGTESDLYIIDPFPAPGTLTHIGALPWNKVEALEFAFGDYDPKIVAVPGVPGPWRANGLLFGFSDAFDMLMIIDPSSGNAVPFPGSFITVDCEGLVFVTYLSDPLYEALLGYD